MPFSTSSPKNHAEWYQLDLAEKKDTDEQAIHPIEQVVEDNMDEIIAAAIAAHLAFQTRLETLLEHDPEDEEDAMNMVVALRVAEESVQIAWDAINTERKYKLPDQSNVADLVPVPTLVSPRPPLLSCSEGNIIADESSTSMGGSIRG